MKKIVTILIFLYCISVPIDFLTGRFFSGISASSIISIPLLVLFVFHLVIKKEMYFPKTILILFLIPIVGTPQLLIYGNYPIDRIVTYFFYLISTLSVINLVVYYQVRLKYIVLSTSLGVILMCIYLVSEGTLGYGGTRLTTINRDLNPNNASGFVLLGIATSIWFLSKSVNKVTNLFGAGTLILFSLVLVLLQSKTSFIAFTCSLAILFTLRVVNKYIHSEGLQYRKVLPSIVKIGLITSVGYLTLIKILDKFDIDMTSLNRINDLFSGDLQSATTGRSEIWGNAFSQSNFILGTGFLSFREEYSRKAHSVYVSTFMETGMLGIILLISFYILFFVEIKRMVIRDDKSLYTYTFIILFLIIFGFGNEVMEFKFFWQALVIVYVVRFYFKEKVKSGLENQLYE